jgi:hypothetical protein
MEKALALVLKGAFDYKFRLYYTNYSRYQRTLEAMSLFA